MRQVTHALLTRPPLSHSSVRKRRRASFDLHVLSTPPAFILSQDQTLVKSVCFQSRITTSNSFLTLLFLVHQMMSVWIFLFFGLSSNCSCTRKQVCSFMGLRPILTHSFARKQASRGFISFGSSHDLQKFSGVNSCHLLFNYQCSE